MTDKQPHTKAPNHGTASAMNYYPDRIADDSDDDVLTSCSAVGTVEGGVSYSGGALHHNTVAANDEVAGDYGQHNNSKPYPWKRKDGDNSDSNLNYDDNDSVELENSRHGDTEKEEKMAHMIQHERDRRLGVVGVRNNIIDDQVDNSKRSEEIKQSNENYNSSSNNLLGNIRGWFGGVGGSNNANQQQSNQHIRRQQSLPDSLVQDTKYAHRAREGVVESDDDSSSTSSDDCSSSDDDDDDSSSDSENDYAEENLTPQERARTRALRYLSNSCVDAGRRAKTASYVRGLERLDLKRKRDRFEKELDIVETEMNKDRGLITNAESDCVVTTAAKLVLELPCISEASSDGSINGQVLTTYDEYMAMMVNNDDPDKALSSLWDNKETSDTYVSSLQSRLKEALERTRSLEKRLNILEQAGDEIIMSLCEDLVEVTGDSNKAEARYVKKGKELQRQRRRAELRYTQKIKKAERHVRHLEERLLSANERARQAKGDESVASSDSSESSDDDEQENDEVRLEAKLSSIKTKIEENKADHKAEMESVRRQCEQLKLRMSVTRLVMEGDENLREYVSILVRAQSKLLDRGAAIPMPPQSINRARARLLKVVHLENIYEQRLSVSKAFSDATINALEQELIERETSGQKMEVRCLNELVAIERETNSLAQDANNRIAELEAEARELEETVAACSGENMAVAVEDLAIIEAQSLPATDDDSSSESYSDEEADDPQPALAIDRRDADTQKSDDGIDNKSIREGSRNDTPELEDDDAASRKDDENHATLEEFTTATSPASDNGSDGEDATKQDALTSRDCNHDETPDKERSSVSDGLEEGREENSDGNPTNNASEQGDIGVDKQAPSEDVTETMSINNGPPSIDNSCLGNNTNSLELLGYKLKDTLSQYQKSRKSRDSTSAERVKHLTNMNLLVLEIAKAKGVDLESTPKLETLTSWRRKKSRSDRKRPEREKKRRSEKDEKRRRGKEKGRRKQRDERSMYRSRHKDERNLSLIW